MITKLTSEQKARLPEFVEKWTKIGLCTEPANRAEAEEAIKWMYKQGKLKEPKIVWCSSPLANGLSRAVILNSCKDASVWASVWASVRASVWDSVRDSVGASVGASVRASVGASVRDSVWDSVGASVWASVGDSVRASVRDSVRDSVWDSIYGQHDANWLGFYDYFKEVCGLAKQTAKLDGLWRLAKSANWCLPHQDICWVSERHNILHLKNNRLHCEDGMALAHPDGWGIYALNGVRMKPEYVLTPADKLSPETIVKEKNAEVRRELLRKIGVLRMKSYGKPMDKSQDGVYELIDMSPIMGISYAPHLLMKNPSVEAWHLEPVPKECKTIKQALHARKPKAMRGIPISEKGEYWYQQGDVCIFPEKAITLQEYPTILT